MASKGLEREQFEAWVHKHHRDSPSDNWNGRLHTYDDDELRIAWEAWQAARAEVERLRAKLAEAVDVCRMAASLSETEYPYLVRAARVVDGAK